MQQAVMTISQIDIKDFVGFCVSRLQLGQGSIRNIKADFRYLARWCGDRSFTKEMLEEFFLSMKTRKLSHSYLNKFLHISRYLDKYVKSRDLGDFSFVWEFQSYTIIRPPFEILDNMQIEALYEVRFPYGVFHGKDRTEELNFLHTTIIMFLSQTGCRFGELQDLRVKDINIVQGKVIFTETKNGTYRYNFIYSPLLGRLQRLIEGKKNEDLIFTNSHGNKIVGQDFNQDLKKRCQATGIIPKWEEITTHTFRHSLIVELLSQGVPMAEVATWVGHQDFQSTFYYYKSLDAHLRSAISHHRLIRQGIDARQLLKQLEESVEGSGLSGDERFGVRQEKTENSFSLTVYIK